MFEDSCTEYGVPTVASGGLLGEMASGRCVPWVFVLWRSAEKAGAPVAPALTNPRRL
ncbi:hypothetical protein ABT369_01065 [Dactylosporangium sp. NPDC000244]|uniref:hypothetical protein n=1 Tax=Dactylosporangium sp. NPDC000244 TaxID=3154365 RepID=UPI003328A2E3